MNIPNRIARLAGQFVEVVHKTTPSTSPDDAPIRTYPNYTLIQNKDQNAARAADSSLKEHIEHTVKHVLYSTLVRGNNTPRYIRGHQGTHVIDGTEGMTTGQLTMQLINQAIAHLHARNVIRDDDTIAMVLPDSMADSLLGGNSNNAADELLPPELIPADRTVGLEIMRVRHALQARNSLASCIPVWIKRGVELAVWDNECESQVKPYYEKNYVDAKVVIGAVVRCPECVVHIHI